MAPLAPAPELLIGMKTMVPAPLKSGVTPPLIQTMITSALIASELARNLDEAKLFRAG